MSKASYDRDIMREILKLFCNLECQDENDYPGNLQFTFHHIPFSCPGCCTPFMSGSQRTETPPSSSIDTLFGPSLGKEEIKRNRTLISASRFSLLSCRRKEPSPGRLPQIKASCLPLAASPIRITTKPAETIIYSF